MSHDCNLRCKYCFASTGDFGTGRKTMPPEIAKKAIDFVIEKSGARQNIEVDFFGGEPLMAMETVRQTVDYARSIEKQHKKHFRFTITTNGVGLNDENIEYINREMANCVLSLDGRPEVNDKNRVTPAGGGSYDIILPKFQKLLQSRGKDRDYYVRGTFTRDNLDFAEDVLHIADQEMCIRDRIQGGEKIMEQKKEKGLRIRSCLTGAIWLALVFSTVISALWEKRKDIPPPLPL